ncbi:MAG: NADP-dependent oxidoreductase [Candidatus Methanoperedens sp.]|nr:NADP-dependent oxidoreductase [Candidatus Methanoperedens sp.]
MKAAQIKKYGGSEVVEINNNAPEPAVSEGHLLVEVHAAGVNPVDWKIREGYMAQMIPLKFPATLGGDFSGVVVEVGGGASGFKKGDEVYGQAGALRGGSGSFAEFVLSDIKVTARKPENINHVEAAALPLTGVSAWQALVDHIGLSRGKKILIHGGAGGIGTVAIQLAKHLGAYVAATVGAKDMQYARELGADEVIDYKNQSFDDILHNYEAVFDTVGGDTYEKSFKILKKGGIIVSMLEQPNPLLMKQYGVNAIGQFTQVNSERLSKVAELAEKRVIKVHVDKIFPLDQAREALEFLQTGHPRGKVVLKMKNN